MAKTTVDFGKFLTGLAQEASPATKETLDGLKEKMEKEKQAKLETNLRWVFEGIQVKVEELRLIRRAETGVKKNIETLEALANKFVAGEEVTAEDMKGLSLQMQAAAERGGGWNRS